MADGVILKGVGGLYSVFSDKDDCVYSCTARGIFRKDSKKPLIGDRVKLADKNSDKKTAYIAELLPRKNSLKRPAVANVDKIIFTAAALNPKPDLILLDKMIIAAEMNNIELILMINKSDQNQLAAEDFYAQYEHAVKCFITSAEHPKSFEAVTEYIDGFCTVIAGQSGTGKSTFVNNIAGQYLMDTGSLSEKTGRGRHTTRHSELFIIKGKLKNNTFIIDSPGFSMFETDETNPKYLQNYYPEMYNNKSGCRYMDCSHTGEPGCFVSELVKSGKMHTERLKRYVLIYKELSEKYRNRYK